MTIQEAIKTGKPFKRPPHINWYFIDKRTDREYLWIEEPTDYDDHFHPFVEDLLADDWEIKQ